MSLNTVNYGNQIISYDYKQNASSSLFNRIMSSLIPHGIYAGGLLTRLDNVQINVAKLTAFIRSNASDADQISVRAESQEDQILNLSFGVSDPLHVKDTLPYIVLRYGWNEQENNFVDFRAVAFSTDPAASKAANQDNELWPDDLIVGKVLLVLDGLTGKYFIDPTNPFDLTRRADVFLPDSQAAFTELKVMSAEGQPKKVAVSGGSINTSKGRKLVTGGNYPTSSFISDTTTFGRFDIVYVDENGIIQIEEGSPSASPVAPLYKNRKVIAQIERGASRTSIIGPEIRTVNVTRQGSISAADYPIADVGGYYVTKTIEAALQQVYAHLVSLLDGTGTAIAAGLVKDFSIDWGTGANQVSAGDMPILDTAGLITATDVENAFAELAGAGRTTQSLKSIYDALQTDISNLVTTNSNLSTHIAKDLGVGDSVHGITVVDVIT